MELSARDLSVTLGGRRVLGKVTATLRPGRVTVILGPNGAGKSTLLGALAGLIAPQAGVVTLGGIAVGAMPPRERARAIGYLPQQPAIHWNLPSRELAALGRLPHRSSFAGESEADRAAVARALAATDTTSLAERRVAAMSGGERTRVLLARVLAGEPAWLLADEPLANLDLAHQIDLLDRLAAAARGGVGVALVLHDLAQAGRVADDVLVLADGRVVAGGPAEEVIRPEVLGPIYGVRLQPMPAPDGRTLLLPVGRL